jgi:glycine cleavage system aminomethyltransferase T
MGYVDIAHSKNETPVSVSVRGKHYPAVVSAMPFLPTSYFKVEA